MQNKHLHISIFLCLMFVHASIFPQDSIRNSVLGKSLNPDTLMLEVDALNELIKDAIQENKIPEALDYSQQAVDICKKVGYAEGEITALIQVAEAYKKDKKYNQAIHYYYEALKKAQTLDSKKQIARIYVEIGLLYKTWNAPKKALEYFEKAHQILKDEGDVENIYLMGHIAFIHFELENYQESLPYYKRMLKVYQNTNQENAAVNALRFIANIHESTNMYKKALLVHQEILKIKQNNGDLESVANRLNNIGYLYKKMKKYKSALEYFRKALAKNKELGKPKIDNITILRNIGVIEHSLGNTMSALKSYEETLDIVEEAQQPKDIASTCNYISSIYVEQRNYKQAEEYTLRATKIAEEHKDHITLLKSYQRLTQIYELSYKTKKAYKYYRKYQQLRNQINEQEITRLKLQVQQQKKIDVMEEEIKKSLDDKEKAQLEAARIKEEYQRKAQALLLLQRDKELQDNRITQQKLKQEASERESSLLKQRLKTQLREQQIARIKQKQTLKDLESQKNSEKQIQREKTLKKELKTARKLDEINKRVLQDEKKIKKYYQLLVAFFIGMLALVALNLFFKQKAHRKIKMQAHQLQEKNTELEMQREEISVQKERIERSYVNMDIISKIGQKVTATLDMEEIMEIVYQDIKALMPADRFGIGKYEKDNQIIDYQYYMKDNQKINNFRTAISAKKLGGWLIQNQRYVFMNDTKIEYSRYIADLSEYPDDMMPNAVICVPLVIKDRVIGIINVQSLTINAYEKYHLDMLQTLASYVSIAVYNSEVYNSLKDANSLIQEKNKHITDSIRYAQTIQHAVLPSDEDFQVFEDSFVLFLPKDIVSGDFYWVHAHGNTTYIATVDCTGHGVPGAFMSMLGNDILDETVNAGVTDPPEILETLHQRIFERLGQKSGINDDGMDVCLCKITYPENIDQDIEIVYSGAKRPLFYEHHHEIREIRGSNKAIGGRHKSNKCFVGVEMQIPRGSTLYLTTDGYIDQSNTKLQKFGKIQFLKILNRIRHKTMSEQRTSLVSALQMHQKKVEQRDDITVIGIRL